MISHTTERFRKALLKLPEDIQRKAKRVYKIWKHEPYSKVLYFKQVHANKPIYSVRIALAWRALGIRDKPGKPGLITAKTTTLLLNPPPAVLVDGSGGLL